MKAIMCRAYGDLSVLKLEEIADPVAGPGQALVRIRACGINFADSIMTAGKYQNQPELPFTPGSEIAGDIVALGAGVEGFSVGDRVMGLPGRGGYAELVAVDAGRLTRLPDGLSYEQAASFAVTYGTSHVALLHRARLQAGETLLVHGAAGGVGLTAVEIGRIIGARIIATAGGPEKLAIARAAGAHETIDYLSEDIRKRVKELTGGRGADVVYDPIGGDVFDASLRCVAFEGRILVIGFAGGRVPQIPANHVMVKNVDIIGVNRPSYDTLAPEVSRRSQEQLLDWLAEGKLRPLVSRTFPLERAVEALDSVVTRKSTGKVVITP
ncbi:NADPH:quinone oxidoreductase family protein [Iodidimonas sp. SYSU 1G8]|uniref:NADPH:quinone oxidoreductase family protein n=1 Tax=Iodidimonas sp. SYSU 1G8 TaxID=3133967 RepID=UPI0031FE72AB